MGTKDYGCSWRQAEIGLFGVILDWSQIRCSLVLNRMRWRVNLQRGGKIEAGEIEEAPCYPELHRHPALLIYLVGVFRVERGQILCHTWNTARTSWSLYFSLYQRCLCSYDQRGAGEETAPTPERWRNLPPFSFRHPGDDTLSLSVTNYSLTGTVHMEKATNPENGTQGGKFDLNS